MMTSVSSVDRISSCGTCCRTEFHPRNFLLGYDYPQHFVKFQWGWPNLYIGWRVLCALYHIAWIIATGFLSHEWAGPDPQQQVKWFIYLTDWSYFMLTISTIVDVVVVVYIRLRRKDISNGDASTMTWYLKAFWVIFNVANAGSLLTSLLYWGLLFSPGKIVTAVDAATHAVNSIYLLINLAVTGVPVRFYHFFHPMAYGAIYILFSVFYWLAGGTNASDNPYIYSVVDWNNPGTAAMYACLTVFVGLPVVHFIIYGIYVLRYFIYTRCCKEEKPSNVDFTELHVNQANN